ncbi:mitochondrial carrier domain-containing protein [Phascolomyces articulosus]|uniref:Mitochondrial carrier domain-containing protein n=1 Tax=Phascolomyces articulosus TaxID=60185 RepID=A0AAD5JPD0_9FUNG|nr:mitochondrial carrier domain-containing protein [Phascolomyces articulosus]
MTLENLRNESLLDIRGNVEPHTSSMWWDIVVANRTALAASCAAVTSVLSGFPFDSVKTRMQTHHYNSLMECVKITYKEEGARGFFRGMIPPLITVSAIKSVSFSIYEGTKYRLRHYPGLHGQTLGSLTALASISGASSGAFIAILSCPLELIKIQRQLEQMIAKEKGLPAISSSSWNAARQIVQKKGVFGLWSGLRCHTIRETMGTSIYFGTYETVKRVLNGNRPDAKSSPMTHFMAGGMCGVLSWLIVFPVDLVKSRLQKQVMMDDPKFKTIRSCAMDVIQRDGVRGLYRGLNVTLLRAFPIHSLQFLVLEYVYSLIPLRKTP